MAPRILLIAIAAVVIAGAAAAQESWSERTAAGEWAFSRGEIERSESEFRAALELAQAFPEGDRRLETSLSNLARLYEHQLRWNEAQPLYQLLLAVQERRLGPDDPALLDTLFAVGRASIPIGDAPTAEASLSRYLAITDEADAGDASQRWQAASLLARVLSLQDRDREAVGYQRAAVAAMADDRFASDLDRAVQLETLAQLELTAGTPDRAQPVLEEAADLRSSEEGKAGSAEVWAGAASTALGAGELELAEGFAERAVAADGDEVAPEEALGVLADVSWLRVRRGSSELADLRAADVDSRELAEAVRRHVDVLEVQDEALALDDPDRVETLSRLAQMTVMSGDLDAAVRWQRAYSEAVAGAGGERAVLAEDSLAYLLTEAGRYDEALAVNGPLLSRLEMSWGADDPRLVPVLSRQEQLLAELGRKKEAKKVRKRLRKMTR